MNIPMGSGSVYFEKLLKEGFGAYLYCDEYDVYKKLENITFYSGLVFTKRKFNKILIVNLDNEIAKTGENYLRKVFALENYAEKQENSLKERYSLRQTNSKAVIDEFYT